MHAAAVPDDHESSGQLLHHRLQEGGHIPVIEVAVGQGMCEPTTHRGAWRVTTTVNASWRRVSAGTAACLVEKCRLLGHPLGSGELATGAWVDPPVQPTVRLLREFLGRPFPISPRRNPCCGTATAAPGVTSTHEDALLPPPISTMRCRFGVPETLRCAVGKSSTMRCRFARRLR